jgi:hypothetical protein
MTAAVVALARKGAKQLKIMSLNTPIGLYATKQTTGGSRVQSHFRERTFFYKASCFVS